MDTLEHIFGAADNWSTCVNGTAEQTVNREGDVADKAHCDQGLPARCTGSSRLGSDFLATSPSREMGSRRRNFWRTPALDVAQVEVAAMVDGQGMNPVELARSLTFGECA